MHEKNSKGKKKKLGKGNKLGVKPKANATSIKKPSHVGASLLDTFSRYSCSLETIILIFCMLSLSLALKYHPPHCVDQLSSIPPSKILATSCGIARIQNTEIPLGELKNTESKMTRVF